MIGGHGAPRGYAGTSGGDTSGLTPTCPGTIKGRGARAPASVTPDLACAPAAVGSVRPAAAPQQPEQVGGRPRPELGAGGAALDAGGWGDGPVPPGTGLGARIPAVVAHSAGPISWGGLSGGGGFVLATTSCHLEGGGMGGGVAGTMRRRGRPGPGFGAGMCAGSRPKHGEVGVWGCRACFVEGLECRDGGRGEVLKEDRPEPGCRRVRAGLWLAVRGLRAHFLEGAGVRSR